MDLMEDDARKLSFKEGNETNFEVNSTKGRHKGELKEWCWWRHVFSFSFSLFDRVVGLWISRCY